MDIALIIGIPVVIILAAVTVLASARRRSSERTGRTVGRLGGETKASDSSAVAVADDTSRGRAGTRRGDQGRGGRRARDPRHDRPRRDGPGRLRGDPGLPAPVLQPVAHHHDGREHRRVRRRGDLVPVREVGGRVRRQGRRRHRPRRRAGLLGREQGAVLRARGPHLPPALPDRGRAPGEEGPRVRAGAPRDGAGHRGALPEVRAPRVPRAVVPDLAVVRVPVPRLEVQPGRREEGWPGTAGPRPLRRHHRRRRR